ncbi:DUF6049 family protein [Streptomyces sp. NPDC005438]|uniref:DUF6049 family protein n=1 Tax=Streptomyces sp. NPDC005438 TaxID=3156880 RepID=UPI0033BDBBA5
MAEAADNQGTPNTRRWPARRWASWRAGRTRRATLGGATLALAVLPLLTAAHAGPETRAPGATEVTSQVTGQGATTNTTAQRPATSSGKTARPAATPDGSRTVDVSLTSLSPKVPEDGDKVTLTGTLTNNGRSSVREAHLALRVGPALAGRSAIEQYRSRKGFDPGLDGAEVGDKYQQKLTSLAPGISRSFSLQVPVSALNMDSSGVYPLSVTVSGQNKREPYPHVLGLERTFLPWQKGTPETKTELTALWPLISRSHLTARTDTDEQQTPIFRDDDLAREIAPGGRLQQMVALGRDLPITWVIDPDLLASVEAMTQRYRVEDPDGGDPVPGKGRKYANEWLNDLQQAVQGEEVVALPFADPDLASLAHRGINVRGALSGLAPATELARETVGPILHTEVRTQFAWPVNGALDSAIVDVATSAGAHNLIARGDSLSDQGLSYTPTASRPIGGGNTAVVADTTLSRSFEGDLTSAGASTRAVQRFLAHTQALTAEVPNRQRNILMAPQRLPTTSQAQAMAQALTALHRDGSWTRGVSLSETAEAKPDARANRRVPAKSAYPRSLRKQELPTKAYEDMRLTRTRLADFQVILSQADRVVPPFSNAMNREMSNSWRGHRAEGERYRRSVHSYLGELTRKVRLIQKSRITLSGRSATIPITVQNNLVQRVDGLELRLKSSRRIGLDVGDPQPVRVDAGHSQSVKFDTTAKANGRAWVEAQLYTKDNKPYGPPMRFQTNVTSITSSVLLVIAGGVLLVVLAGIRMYTQRKRRAAARVEAAREAREEAAREGAEDAAEGATEGNAEEAGDGESAESADGGDDTGSSPSESPDGTSASEPRDGDDGNHEDDGDTSQPAQPGERGQDTQGENGTGPHSGEKVDR